MCLLYGCRAYRRRRVVGQHLGRHLDDPGAQSWARKGLKGPPVPAPLEGPPDQPALELPIAEQRRALALGVQDGGPQAGAGTDSSRAQERLCCVPAATFVASNAEADAARYQKKRTYPEGRAVAMVGKRHIARTKQPEHLNELAVRSRAADAHTGLQDQFPPGQEQRGKVPGRDESGQTVVIVGFGEGALDELAAAEEGARNIGAWRPQDEVAPDMVPGGQRHPHGFRNSTGSALQPDHFGQRNIQIRRKFPAPNLPARTWSRRNDSLIIFGHRFEIIIKTTWPQSILSRKRTTSYCPGWVDRNSSSGFGTCRNRIVNNPASKNFQLNSNQMDKFTTRII